MSQTRAIPPQLILAHAVDDLVERGDDLRGLPRQPPRHEDGVRVAAHGELGRDGEAAHELLHLAVLFDFGLLRLNLRLDEVGHDLIERRRTKADWYVLVQRAELTAVVRAVDRCLQQQRVRLVGRLPDGPV